LREVATPVGSRKRYIVLVWRHFVTDGSDVIVSSARRKLSEPAPRFVLQFARQRTHVADPQANNSAVLNGGKISQEFTWCVTACQEMSWRVRASQDVSRTTSRRRCDGLPAAKPGDTVRCMVQGLREVQEVAADAGESRVSARPTAAWRGTRNTVPSRAFAAVSAVAGGGHPSKIEGPR
jgi:hypothetical protein